MRFYTLFFTLISISAFSQDRKYSISISYGKYLAPEIPKTYLPADSNKSKSKDYFSMHFAYQIRRRLSLMTSFASAKFNYYDDTRSNAWEEITKYKTGTTNARGYDSHAFFTVNYDIVDIDNKFKTLVGTGLGIRIRRLKYPSREPCSSGCAVFIGESSSMSISIPLNAKSYFIINDRIGVGINIGSFLDEDFKLFGLHGGPEVRLQL